MKEHIEGLFTYVTTRWSVTATAKDSVSKYFELKGKPLMIKLILVMVQAMV